jgi:signal transduction histidine kinase/CheY-like chemotaxis protein
MRHRSKPSIQPAGTRPRWRLHRLSVLVLALTLTVTVGAHLLATHLVDDHERDLLREAAGEITVLFEQLGSTYQSKLVGVAAIAEVTDGDPGRFADSVEGTEPGGAWALYRQRLDGLERLTTVGDVTVDLRDPPREWSAVLDRTPAGEFAVLGITGSGPARYLGLVARAGDLVVYDELSLLGAAAQSAAEEAEEDSEAGDGQGSEAYDAFNLALYVGDRPTEDGFIFKMGEPGADAIAEVVSVGGTDVTLVIDSDEDLGGSLISRWPMMVVALGVVVGIGLTSAIELSLRRRDDTLRQVRHLAAANADLDRALVERQRAEQATAAVEAELRQMQRLEVVGQLAGGVAHDFNNLLAVILSYTDLLERQLPADATSVQADLAEIREAARRGADLTRRLLQFSRQEPHEVTAVDVGGVIRDLSRLLERTIGEDITLRLATTEEPSICEIDVGAFEQALLNLVINARDALDGGGNITIETGREELDDEEASLRGLTPGAYVRLAVADDGSGMDPEVVRRAFDPFFTTKERGQGTGLGLATVYGTVKGADGHISIESVPGEGTHVTVLLPQSSASPTAAAKGRKGTETQPGMARVLLVEDERAVRSAQRRMLEDAGYEVVEAADGNAAIEAFAAGGVDLLITDLVMPGGVSGADVAASLRAEHADLPALFVTGYGGDLLAQRGIELEDPTSSVLSKPFSEHELLSAVHDALAGADR